MRAGQHFLVDREYIMKELQALSPSKSDSVLEIGSGEGHITRLIAEKAKKVIAIEKDPMLMIVAKTNSPPNIIWKLEDALKLNFESVDLVFSNVHYYISSPLLLKIIKWGEFKRAILSFQKEFAQRLIALPSSKEYGRISVIFKLLANAEPLFDIPPWAFKPRPKIWSSVIEVKPREKRPVSELGKLEPFTSALFSQKNRLIPKALCKLKMFDSQAEAIKAIDDYSIAKKRVRELTPEEVLFLSKKLGEKREIADLSTIG